MGANMMVPKYKFDYFSFEIFSYSNKHFLSSTCPNHFNALSENLNTQKKMYIWLNVNFISIQLPPFFIHYEFCSVKELVP